MADFLLGLGNGIRGFFKSLEMFCLTAKFHTSRSNLKVWALIWAGSNIASFTHRPSLTNRPVHVPVLKKCCCCSCTSNASFIYSPPLLMNSPFVFLTALKWQNSVWIYSVVCTAHAGLLHQLPQSQELAQSERKLTRLSSVNVVRGTALYIREVEVTEEMKMCMDIY